MTRSKHGAVLAQSRELLKRERSFRRLRGLLRLEHLEERRLLAADVVGTVIPASVATAIISSSPEIAVGDRFLDAVNELNLGYSGDDLQGNSSSLPATGISRLDAYNENIMQAGDDPYAQFAAAGGDIPSMWDDIGNFYATQTDMGGETLPSALKAIRQQSLNPDQLRRQMIGGEFVNSSKSGNRTAEELASTQIDSILALMFQGKNLQPSSQSRTSQPLTISVQEISAGAFCAVDGSHVVPKIVSTGEGEEPSYDPGYGTSDGDYYGDGGYGDGGYGDPMLPPPIEVPRFDWPEMDYIKFDGSLDVFRPAVQSTLRNVETLGVFNEYSTILDAQITPGLNWVRITDQNFIDSTHWTYSESLLLGAHLSNSLTDADNALLSATRDAWILLEFTASQGITTDPNAGTRWSTYTIFGDAIGFGYGLQGNREIDQRMALSWIAADESVASPTSEAGPPELPEDFGGHSDWANDVGMALSVAGQFSLSSLPEMLPGGSNGDPDDPYGYDPYGYDPYGYGIDTSAVSYSIHSSGEMTTTTGLQWDSGWNSDSKSGDLQSTSPGLGAVGLSPEPGRLTPTSGRFTVDNAALELQRQGSLGSETLLGDLEGQGHETGESGDANDFLDLSSHADWNIVSQIDNHTLRSLQGKLSSGLLDKYGGELSAGKLHTWKKDDVLEFSGSVPLLWSGEIAFGYDLEFDELASLTDQVDLELGLDQYLQPTYDPTGSIAKVDLTSGGILSTVTYLDMTYDEADDIDMDYVSEIAENLVPDLDNLPLNFAGDHGHFVYFHVGTGSGASGNELESILESLSDDKPMDIDWFSQGVTYMDTEISHVGRTYRDEIVGYVDGSDLYGADSLILKFQHNYDELGDVTATMHTDASVTTSGSFVRNDHEDIQDYKLNRYFEQYSWGSNGTIDNPVDYVGGRDAHFQQTRNGHVRIDFSLPEENQVVDSEPPPVTGMLGVEVVAWGAYPQPGLNTLEHALQGTVPEPDPFQPQNNDHYEPHEFNTDPPFKLI